MFINSETVEFDDHTGSQSCFCLYNVANYQETLFEKYGIAKESGIECAVIKRQAEYLAGRYAAKQALRSMGQSNVAVITGNRREPIWPVGMIGSISHTNRSAVCSVASLDAVDYLGVDIANNITVAKSCKVSRLLINQHEHVLINQLAMAFSEALTLVFSVKESLYKALYPYVRAYFGFKAAVVTKIDVNNALIDLKLGKSLSPKLPKGLLFTAQFTRHQDYVVTKIIGRFEPSVTSRKVTQKDTTALHQSTL